MKILVTGANGFLGSHVTEACAEAGHEVIALVLPGTPTDEIAHLDVALVAADVTRPRSLRPAMRGVEAVVHLAALASDWGPWSTFRAVNVEGTRHLLEAARAAGATRFVLVSSVAVHAYRDYGAGADEETARDGGALPYGRSKIEAEDLVRAAHDAGELEAVVVRPGLVPFGPRDRQAFVPLARGLERGALPLVDGGRARFTTAYAGNLADGLLATATHPAAAGRTYLLADERVVTWREYFRAIADALGCPPPRRSLPGWLAAAAGAASEELFRHLPLPGVPPMTRYRARVVRSDLVFRSDRARRELAYRPRVGLEEGLRRTVRWYRRAGSAR